MSCIGEKGMDNHTILIHQQYYHVSPCHVCSAASLPPEELENNSLTPVPLEFWKTNYSFGWSFHGRWTVEATPSALSTTFHLLSCWQSRCHQGVTGQEPCWVQACNAQPWPQQGVFQDSLLSFKPKQLSALALLSSVSSSPDRLAGQLHAAAPALIVPSHSAPASALLSSFFLAVMFCFIAFTLGNPHFGCWCCSEFLVWK